MDFTVKVFFFFYSVIEVFISCWDLKKLRERETDVQSNFYQRKSRFAISPIMRLQSSATPCICAKLVIRRSVTTSEQSVVICTATYPWNTSALTFDNAISFPWKSLLPPRLGKRCSRLKSNSDGAVFPPSSCRFPRPQTLLKRNFLSEKAHASFLYFRCTISFEYGEIVSLFLCPKTVFLSVRCIYEGISKCKPSWMGLFSFIFLRYCECNKC